MLQHVCCSTAVQAAPAWLFTVLLPTAGKQPEKETFATVLHVSTDYLYCIQLLRAISKNLNRANNQI